MKLVSNKIVLLIAAIAAVTVIPAHATEFNQLVAAKSAVSFIFKQMNVPVTGSFKRYTGQIDFDPANPTLAKASIDIALDSIDAGSEEANDAVADKLWFNTKVYPVAHFVSTSVKPLGNNRFEIAGKMTIKGKTLATSTPATFHQEGSDGVFEGSFILKRADYAIGEGMWADFGTVANEVQIRFKLVATATGKKQ